MNEYRTREKLDALYKEALNYYSLGTRGNLRVAYDLCEKGLFWSHEIKDEHMEKLFSLLKETVNKEWESKE